MSQFISPAGVAAHSQRATPYGRRQSAQLQTKKKQWKNRHNYSSPQATTVLFLGHFFLESEPNFSDLAGLLTRSPPVGLPTFLWRNAVAILLTDRLPNSQQRDCSGLSPDSLFMPLRATKSAAKIQHFSYSTALLIIFLYIVNNYNISNQIF